MKAHISSHPLLLCWQLTDAQLKDLSAIAEDRQFLIRTVARREVGKTVGALCGAPGSKKNTVPVPENITEKPILVLFDFNDDQVDGLLETLKVQGMDIRLKAMVNKTNRDWAFCELARQLDEELAAFTSVEIH